MRREADDFADQEMALVYVARKLKDALRLEEWLTAASVDYVVQADRYTVGRLFRRERVGAFFYVPASDEGAVRERMLKGGFAPFDEES